MSHSLSEKCVMSPETTLPPHPYPPGGRRKGPTDHFPVSLHFYPPNLSKGARFKIPEWIATHPTLHKRILSTWATSAPSRKPGKNWLSFKKVIQNEARTFMKEHRDSALSKATTLTRSISVFRGLQSASMRQSIAIALAALDPKLKSALDSDLQKADTSFPNVASHIDQIFRDHPMLVPTTKHPNLLRQAKNTLPCGKRTLSHLFSPDGKRVDSSPEMAALLKAQWSPVWNKPNPPPLTIDD